jgi:hypothetical protein
VGLEFGMLIDGYDCVDVGKVREEAGKSDEIKWKR